MTTKDKIMQYVEAESAVPFRLVVKLMSEYEARIHSLLISDRRKPKTDIEKTLDYAIDSSG